LWLEASGQLHALAALHPVKEQDECMEDEMGAVNTNFRPEYWPTYKFMALGNK
jgi:hypothetical protein